MSMKENYLEGIYGCLERIEKKMEMLSSTPMDGNNAVKGGEDGIAVLREVKDGLERELNGMRRTFSQYVGSLLAASKNIQEAAGRNLPPDRTAEILAGIRTVGEQTSEQFKALLKTAGGRPEGRICNEHRHTLSIESKGVLWTFTGMVAMVIVLAVALYVARQPDRARMDNDLKYRYIRMKGGVSPGQITELENLFGLNRENEKISQMRRDVETYEEAVCRQAALIEQARLKERAAREQGSKADSIRNRTSRPRQ